MIHHFPPPRQRGLLLQLTASTILAGVSAALLWQAVRAPAGIDFLIQMFLSLALFAPVPVLLYRAYALYTATYILERDGIRLHWGLRVEDIPLPEVEWIRPATDLVGPLPPPLFSWTGAFLGSRTVEGLGPIEYMASDWRRLLLLATPHRIYAISPEDPKAFLKLFRSAMELGSLSPLRPQTVNPAVVVGRVWSDRTGRVLVLTGLLFGLALLVWVSLVIPTRTTLSLGFLPDQTPGDPGPAARLLLLPVLAGFSFIGDLVGGIFFYRRPGQAALAYLLWGAGLVTPVLLLVGVWFILRI